MLRRPDRFLVYAGNAWYEQPQPVSEVVLIDRLHLETKTRLCRRPSRMSAPTFEKKVQRLSFIGVLQNLFLLDRSPVICGRAWAEGFCIVRCQPTLCHPATQLSHPPHLTSHLRALFTIRSIVSSPFALLLSFRDFYWLK